MVSHQPMSGSQTQLRVYDMKIQHLLDEYKHGHLSQEDVLQQQEQALGLLADALRSNTLVRLHNLEALRTPRGHQVPPTGGR